MSGYARSNPAVVIDNGTGYCKMGYAGNCEPSWSIPSCISTAKSAAGGGGARNKDALSDLDFWVGDEALKRNNTFTVEYPMKEGIVQNWDLMERYWQRCMFEYMRCEPEEHYFLLTEPPLNTPENRESTAEIMFETFGVAGMYIAVQAVLALAASWTSGKSKDRTLTGCVVDSGDGVTHVIPVAEGYVIGSCIKHVPLAGSDITKFFLKMLKEREPGFPSENQLEVAKKIKEKYAYCCEDVAKEFARYDKNPMKHINRYSQVDPKSKKVWEVEVGPEQFLAPEVFFNPEIFSSDFITPLPNLIDQTIQQSPLDTRKKLYSNIVLSGGSTMFRKFGARLQKDLKSIQKTRMDARQAALGPNGAIVKEMEVNVISHQMQRFAVWFGGSLLASTPEFYTSCHTKEQYDEWGPSICRHNAVFGF